MWDKFFDGKSTFDRLELLVVVEWMTLIFWKTGKKSTWQHHMERFVDLSPVFNKWVNNCFINTSISQAGFSSWLQIWIFRKCPDFIINFLYIIIPEPWSTFLAQFFVVSLWVLGNRSLVWSQKRVVNPLYMKQWIRGWGYTFWKFREVHGVVLM